MVYTDGTACNPDDHRRRRAAWATCYSPDHPWNCSGPVEGGLQTVYRAELTAVNHAVQAADRPTHIVSDCLSVVNTAAAIFHGNLQAETKGDHSDIWEALKQKVATMPMNHFKATWIPSHTDLARAKENEQKGGYEERMIVGNAHADREAKSAMTTHELNINRDEYDDADDRTFFACIFQHMLKTILEKTFEEDAKLWQESGIDPEHVQTSRARRG